jgi:hypothetical protein
MSQQSENACETKLRELELAGGIIDKFSALGTSSWVSLKNLLVERSLDHLGFSQIDRGAFISMASLRIVLFSLWHYLRHCFSLKRRDLFIGAGSGVFEYHGRMVDGFVPSEVSQAPGVPADDLIYFLSANHLKVMCSQLPFLRGHRAVVYSVLVSPFKVVLGKIGGRILSRNSRLRCAAEELSAHMAAISVQVSPAEILQWHARFCAGVMLFRLVLLPLKVRRAFVVSAYSNSEICAVLRKMGITVTEVQHGIVGPIHRGYNYAVTNERLPTPDYVSVYSDFWKQELITAGYFRPEQIVIAKRLKYVLAEGEARAVEFPYVVFSGQGIMANEVAAFLRELVATAPEWHAIYVPHPAETLEFSAPIAAAASACDRIHVWGRSGATTERLIIDSLAHVSFYSSCHFDSVHYKGETFILDKVEESPMQFYAQRLPQSFITIENAAALVGIVRGKGLSK